MTKEEVKKYIDNYIIHIIKLVEFGNLFSQQIKDLVSVAKKKCEEVLYKHIYCPTKLVCKDAVNNINSILDELTDSINDIVDETLDDVIESENLWLEENVGSTLGINFNFPKNAKNILKDIPIAAVPSAAALGFFVSNRLLNLYNSVIQSSYITGSSTIDILEDYEPRFSAFDRGLKSDTDTVGESLATQYERIVYTKNDKKIQFYIWNSILDTHTCLVCGSLSGQRFTDISKVPIYPAHNSCRCHLLIANEDIVENIPEDYESWFESQDKSIKRQILGKNRFLLYESGTKIKSFVNNGQITPLKDLKK